ncbi:hypothetical protein HCU01_20100 [Halomonas cupida]|uniref:Uncharacterized protein n=1 Tax=Halomonas cupida TaxID=44933 RepID=A0A1M7I8J4_9GAMM|nr:hypothetical protein [Halomonas cupida]GEN24061.1 hypothetical protein HCU01_20100 [Halomonas cupida]SHM36757.1 hypothetical protein SAMN05660971_02850 [Halomonas cupida]
MRREDLASRLSDIEQRLRLRSPDEVMQLERLGSLHASRLSFVRSLVRQMARQRWQISTIRFDLDAEGHGIAIYRLQTPWARYHGVIFSQPLDDAARSDRVIAEAWDATFGVVEGDVDDSLLDHMAANVPLQEAGRQHPRLLVLSRANRSLRNFAAFLDALSAGRQPDPTWLTRVGYLYRTTAVYGNGKFGIADFDRLKHNPDFQRPFSAQMLAVYLLRHFSIEQIEHMARAKAPGRAVAMATPLRRYLGIGNSTGLGMAPFLINHPQLIQRWIESREQALAQVSGQVPGEPDRQRLLTLIARAEQHMAQTVTEDTKQSARNRDTASALPAVRAWLEQVPLTDELWQELIDWSRQTLSLEAQELIHTLLLEIYPKIVDPFEDRMGVKESLELTPDMPLIRLKQSIETHYDWALRHDFEDPDERYWFWYRSMEKEEPRLGVRDVEPGADRELKLAIAARVADTHKVIDDFLTTHPRALVVEFLIHHPRHKDIIRRIQSMAETPFGEIRANLWARDMKPVHILRTKLSFFGASRFDPKSDRWVRITLFQGAPLVEELNAKPCDLIEFDDWSFPLEPSQSAEGTLSEAGAVTRQYAGVST